MILPWIWLRKRKLEPVLKEYPLYDPPHKVEERLLPREQAQENFSYFMRVRLERAAYFAKWLKKNFGVVIGPHERGVAALNRWVYKYGSLLLPSRKEQMGYFTYDPPWTGDAAGCNVVLDIGITVGESLIANCENLRWDMDPISAVRPNDAKKLKRQEASSFQRPALTGFENPAWIITPLYDIELYCWILGQFTTPEGWWRFVTELPMNRHDVKYSMIMKFRRNLKEYRAGDPTTLYGSSDYPVDSGECDE